MSVRQKCCTINCQEYTPSIFCPICFENISSDVRQLLNNCKQSKMNKLYTRKRVKQHLKNSGFIGQKIAKSTFETEEGIDEINARRISHANLSLDDKVDD